MVSGLYKRGHHSRVSAGWRFPLRADSLVFAKSNNNQHHIVHSDMHEGIDKLKDYLRTESAINTSTASLAVSSEPSTPKRSSVCRSAHPGTFSATQLDRRDERLSGSSNVHSWYHSSAALLGERLFAGMGREPSPAHLIASPPLSRQPSGEHGSRDMSAFGKTSSDTLCLAPPAQLGHCQARRFGPDEVVAAAAAGMDASAIIALYTDDADLGIKSSSQTVNIRSVGGRRTPDSDRSGSSEDSCRASNKDVVDMGGSYMDDAHVAQLLGYLPANDIELDVVTQLAGAKILDATSVPLPEKPTARASECSGTAVKQNANQAKPAVFTAAEMEEVRREYRDKASIQSEVREKLVQTLRDEFSESAKSQQLKSAQAIRLLKQEHRQQIAAQEQEFARRVTAEQQRHAREIGQQALAVQAELEDLRGGFASMQAERDDVQAMLEEYVATSSRLIEQKDEECSGLSRELGRLSLDRNRLQEQLDESGKHADALTAERNESRVQAEALVAENTRLEKLAVSLRADVLVAEERSAKIRAHAEEMLSKANAEISRLMSAAALAQQDVVAARARATKADTRSKSLQIQLDSTKRQNEELLSLCERLEGSIR
ncbi:hypothetical protein GGI19_004898 [Coemansia pectinata]|uniref:Transforming acidic coiled-coil-containing protein C-terminal domain-containing protein n=1 Tax=Coemansia pectinata TaxID=1052879 RepID=A0A9W8GUT5_9FUNG|nr:hypothetical protein GGI19_004898 [Coemansia pectinata]